MAVVDGGIPIGLIVNEPLAGITSFFKKSISLLLWVLEKCLDMSLLHSPFHSFEVFNST